MMGDEHPVSRPSRPSPLGCPGAAGSAAAGGGHRGRQSRPGRWAGGGLAAGGRVTGRAGRGAGLVLGYAIGVLGALVVVAARRWVASRPCSPAACCWEAPTPPSSCRATRPPTSAVPPREAGPGNGPVRHHCWHGRRPGPAGPDRPAGAGARGLPRLAGLYLVAVAAFAAAALIVAGLSRSGVPELGGGSRVALAGGNRQPPSRGQLAVALRAAPVRRR